MSGRDGEHLIAAFERGEDLTEVETLRIVLIAKNAQIHRLISRNDPVDHADLENAIWRTVLDSCTTYPAHATTWARGGHRNDVPTLCGRCAELIERLKTLMHHPTEQESV